ncbi:hypothetical protein NET02_08705 [Thermomicrobiaceae bacterium CFH 74404]|uniref:Uncharacterized protein n=1 Tax=Thermalbibacter longus TaxID=2951981 RepID=A0AA42BCX6_9BACT|nr:hypothetical protein [Thermalbibacter longus]MCM8749223.1 hypothetical protein [Thermalbibacter longus]
MADPQQIQRLLIEIGEDVACRHYHEPRAGVDFNLLAGLGLLTPINTRIPPCEAHGCPLLGQCEHEADFAPDSNTRTPRSNRKFRRAPKGADVAADAALLDRLASEHRLAALVAGALRGGKASVFTLAQALLEADLAQVEAGGETAPAVRRRELGAFLRLVEALGWVQFEDGGLTLRALRLPEPLMPPAGPSETA